MEDEIIELNSTSFIEVNFQENEKVKISPVGDVVGVDGRTYKINAQNVIKNIKSRGIDIVLNENHWGSKAFGWFDLNSLEAKTDGIYAHLDLNNLGKPAVENKHYRYLSPEFMVDRERNVTRIVGVGLVNQPNLLNKALNNEQSNPSKPIESEEKNNMKKTVEQLELEVNTLQTSNDQKDKTIESLTNQLKESKVNNAIAAGSLLPANKDFALGLELNQIDGYLSTLNTQPQTQDLNKELNVEQPDEKTENNEVWDQLGITEDEK